MANTLATQYQIPDQAILDAFNRQTYLGEKFSASTNEITIPTAEVETPIMYLSNPSSNLSPRSIGCFQDFRKLVVTANSGSVNFCTFKFYTNPTVSSAGSTLTPINLRPSSTQVSVMNASKSPTINGVAQVQTVDTVLDVAGSLNNTYFLLSDIVLSGAQKDWYVWFNVNSAGTSPALAGRTGIEVDLATGATANEVATGIRAALNALTSDFVATGATSHVIITNVHAGACDPASDGGQPTSFTFHNTTPGSFAFGTYVGVLAVSLTETEPDVLFVLDPGHSLLITAKVSADNTNVAADLTWYEL